MALNQSKLDLWTVICECVRGRERQREREREREICVDVSSPSMRHDVISAGCDGDEELPVFEREKFLD